MKRISRILAALPLILLLSGCGAPSGLSTETPENKNTTDSAPANGSVSSPTGSQPETDPAPTEYKPFRGLPKVDSPISTVNCKDFRPSLLCFSGGNTFFMWDGTVYKHNGETTEALFERNAYDLNYYDGMLYFIENDRYDLSSMDLVHIEGLLYRYDLSKDTVETLTDYPVVLPVVRNGEIFYTHYATADAPESPTGIYRVNEDGTSERLYTGLKHIEYGEYRLKFDWSDEKRVCFSQDDQALLLENVHPYWDCVVDDYYYYRSIDDNSLNRLSLLTGELLTLKPYEFSSADPLFDDEENNFVCQDYTVLNDEIYFIDHYSTLRKYNEATDDYTQISCEYAFRYIYADEENIYGVGCKREENSINKTFHFIKLTIDGDTAKGKILV